MKNKRNLPEVLFIVFLIVAATLVLTACGPSPEEDKQIEAQPTYFEDLGTNTDGCQITKFVKAHARIKPDVGYYVTCHGKPQKAVREYDESCGKSCTRHVVVTTINAAPSEQASDAKVD